MSGKKVAAALLWGVACAVIVAAVLYIKATFIQHGTLAVDFNTIVEIVGGFVAGAIGGVAWQNKKGRS